MSIDAVAIQTAPNHDKCSACGDIAYTIQREPDFTDGNQPQVEEEMFTDQ